MKNSRWSINCGDEGRLISGGWINIHTVFRGFSSSENMHSSVWRARSPGNSLFHKRNFQLFSIFCSLVDAKPILIHYFAGLQRITTLLPSFLVHKKCMASNMTQAVSIFSFVLSLKLTFVGKIDWCILVRWMHACNERISAMPQHREMQQVETISFRVEVDGCIIKIL